MTHFCAKSREEKIWKCVPSSFRDLTHTSPRRRGVSTAPPAYPRPSLQDGVSLAVGADVPVAAVPPVRGGAFQPPPSPSTCCHGVASLCTFVPSLSVRSCVCGTAPNFCIASSSRPPPTPAGSALIAAGHRLSSASRRLVSWDWSSSRM